METTTQIGTEAGTQGKDSTMGHRDQRDRERSAQDPSGFT